MYTCVRFLNEKDFRKGCTCSAFLAVMSAKAISEQTGKEFLYKYICTTAAVQNRFCCATVTADTVWDRLTQDHPWLLTERLVVKPDQLIKRRGKLGLVAVDLNLEGVQEWLKSHLMTEITVGKVNGILKNFLIEPFVPHYQEEEFYVCIYASREGSQVLFHHEGGVDVGDVDTRAQKLSVRIDDKLTEEIVTQQLLKNVTDEKKNNPSLNGISYARNTPSWRSAVREVSVRRPTKFSQCVPHRWLRLVLVGFFRPFRHVESLSELVGPSDHSDWLFSYCHLLIRKDISSYAGAERMCYLPVGRRTLVWCVRATLDPDAADVSQPRSLLLSPLVCRRRLGVFWALKDDKLARTLYESDNLFLMVLGHYKLLCGPAFIPLVKLVTKDGVYILDMAAKIDSAADYICKPRWGDVEFPPPFGREAYPEEAYIADLDAKSGASLKLTLLNPKGRIWTMVAGGGASVVYSDTICDLGGVDELANYGEYSGAPSEQQTYDYAKTILSLMTREKHPDGKVLIIGGSIANFTNVAATFKGIVRAIKDYQGPLKENEVTIFVRRGGPNYQEGLRVMEEVGKTTGIPIHVFGTETHMTAIVGMALGHRAIPNQPPAAAHTANFLLNTSANATTPARTRNTSFSEHKLTNSVTDVMTPTAGVPPAKATTLFSRQTKAIVWGMQTRAVQGMLDFDYVCSRDEPSVVAMVYPFTGDHKQKFYWGHKEILLPVYKNMADAMKKHPDVDVLINFASLRSAFDSTMETLLYPQIHTIAIIAEGIPEALTRKLIKSADEKGVTIIGPATVGGIKPGCFKIGNTGGMLDNILASKLYRPGSVAYVSRSGGMSNELNNIISHTTDGVYEGVAIGGDRFPGSTFMDHVLRYQDTPGVKMIVVLGEIGGTEEYNICQGIVDGRITKPVVCWCIGTCATMFSSEVQFGHAGACANQASETAVAKNQALQEAGAFVPNSFDELGDVIKFVYDDLVANGIIVPAQEVPPPTVPMDYSWARELGLIRKPASFMTSICDERGQELIYAGMPITEVFKEEMGLGGVLGLLWFQRRLPRYACQFIEMCLMVTADHGPAVSGAHNTIVCARAGKDLVSSLTSGLLTIGDRFGGALDAAAKQFSKAFDSGLLPMEFVNKMKKDGMLIMGIGHRVKSINNPDMRVQILKDFVKQHFPSTQLLDYALDVEKITTSKKPNLILNVDGFIGVAFVDLLRTCGGFTRDEADEFIEIGTLNGIFVLGRSIGFIGHYLDQKRLKQGLYRHPWDDISYVLPEHMSM
ncbi:ATP-citrate synthase [Anabarilius grahami]|uniref:ATP-citrate synthase n=1 Tax=Anabarilius grahami TaxID=495550 RepID=A0A3N0Y115_ANAGA|nr:ATP-citrate synthase [Anabarilius grahami]